MERITYITYRDHRILLADCSDCEAQQLSAIIDEIPRYVTREPMGSVLLLADYSRCVFSKETVEHLKVAAVFDRPHLRKAAWVLTENLPQALYDSVRTFSARDLPFFASREEALEYLVSSE